MLIGRTNHLMNMKIQTSSDNNKKKPQGFFKKPIEGKERKYSLMCNDLSCFTQLKSVYIVIKLIFHYNHQCQLLARAL